jgi:hypothetical protein
MENWLIDVPRRMGLTICTHDCLLPTRRPQKITFADLRASGIRGLLIYCSEYHCSHWTAISGDQWLGEAVILGVDGYSDFNALHSGKHNDEVQLLAFDVLAMDGDDLRDLPLSMPKANLARLLARRLQRQRNQKFRE